MEDHAADLAAHGAALTAAVVGAVPAWVAASVLRVAGAAGVVVDPAEVAEAGRAAAGEVDGRLRALLGADLDDQRTTPLSIVRLAVAWPAGVLERAGVAPVARDAFDAGRFPDDAYGLIPATLADLDPAVGEAAITWGAAKAWEHRRRHRPAG